MKLAVIPARGGSKRIPRKNIREFCGRPIIGYSIDAALAAGLFDHVAVSTDDEEIAAVAEKLGAKTPFRRPAELADDHTGTQAVVKHAVDWYQREGQPPSVVCCIYATAPFLQARLIIEGHDVLIRSAKDYTFSVTSFAFPIQRALRMTDGGEVQAMWPEHSGTRSQDLEHAYHHAGQFY